eukprot:sb/3469642/
MIIQSDSVLSEWYFFCPLTHVTSCPRKAAAWSTSLTGVSASATSSESICSCSSVVFVEVISSETIEVGVAAPQINLFKVVLKSLKLLSCYHYYPPLSLSAGKPNAAFNCLTEAASVYTRNPRLWLRIAECAIGVCKEKKGASPPSTHSSTVKCIVGSGTYRKTILNTGFQQKSIRTRTHCTTGGIHNQSYLQFQIKYRNRFGVVRKRNIHKNIHKKIKYGTQSFT